MPKERLFLIDGNSFCYRAYFAIRNLATSWGQPTNAIYGFVTMLNSLIERERPDYLAVTFDLKGPTFRHRKFQKYKIHRRPMPDGLVSQIPLIKEILTAYNIPIFEKEGFEADDIIATLSRRTIQDLKLDVYIVTGDKDILQLVNEHIKVYSPYKEGLVYDEQRVKERFGVEPKRIVELMALMGDPSDNIPGIPGIGERSATELIKRFGTLEELLSNLDKLKSLSQRKILKENAHLARLSRELALCDPNVPIEFDLKKLKIGKPDKDRLFSLYRRLQFKSLLKTVSPETKLKASYRLVSSNKDLLNLLDKLKKVSNFSFELDIISKEARNEELKGVAFCYESQSSCYVPIFNVLSEFKFIFEQERIKKVAHDIKRAKVALANYGINLKGISFDTMVASYLLDPSEADNSLEAITLEYLGYSIPADKRGHQYYCEAANLIFRLREQLEDKLSERNLDGLFQYVELPLIEVLADMQLEGIAVDRGLLSSLAAQMGERIDRIAQKIYEMAGKKFNINSPKQLREVLFVTLNLPIVKKTKTGASTDGEVLESLASQHPLPSALLEYRELSKLKSTYIDGLLGLVDSKTGRIHTSFNQTVTQTGRLSSSHPNLQNIPIKTEMGRQIRKAFVSGSEDCLLLSADYSQIELRILAHLSGDKNLIEAFNSDLDIHAHTASIIFGLKTQDVTRQMREIAKTVNFGITYGMGPYGLSMELKIDQSQAAEFIDSYFSRYPRVKEFIHRQIESAKKSGFVTTLFGRKRYIPQITSKDNTLRQFAERVAINTPVQGSAADLIKIAMIDIYREIKRRGLQAKMVLQVHDELVFDLPKDEIEIVKDLVKRKMETVTELKVPIKVTIKVGKNWLEME